MSEPKTKVTGSTLRKHVIVALILATGIVAACWGAWNYEYGADDVRFVRHYTEVAPGTFDLSVRWGTVARDFVGRWGGNDSVILYRPLVSLSLALDFSVFGLWAGANALVNMLVHGLSAFLLFLLARELLPDRRSAWPAALLFAMSPLVHENITWAVGRCSLTVLFGIASGLCLVRGRLRGRTGLALHGLPLLLCVLNLLTMESALFWTLWPSVCVAVRHAFHPNEEWPGWRGLARDTLPYAALIPAYLGWRIVVLGTITGGASGQLLPSGVLATLGAIFSRLGETILPADTTWLDRGAEWRAYNAVVWVPLVFGMYAPLYFKDPRSRYYRVGLGLLLGFWLLSRLPTLARGVNPDGLEVARDAYYSLAPVTLAVALLVATNRYSFWITTCVTTVVFGLGLHHRTQERVIWAERSAQVRQLVFETALAHRTPLAYINSVVVPKGTVGYHPGELAYALYPPLVKKPVEAISVNVLTTLHQGSEAVSAAWIGAACGKVFSVRASKYGRIETLWLDPDRLLRRLPEGGLTPVLRDGGGPWPELELSPEWRNDRVNDGCRVVVVLVAGRSASVAPCPDSGGWPSEALANLEQWYDHGYDGALFACFVEARRDPDDPTTAQSRSPVRFGRIRRK